MFVVQATLYGVLYKQSNFIAFDETSSDWSAPKAPNFSTFHWSPQGSLVSIGQHFVTTNINTEIEIEADLNTEPDQAMRAVHSCNNWFLVLIFLQGSQLLQLCTARYARSDSVIKLVSVLFGECTTLVVTKC